MGIDKTALGKGEVTCLTDAQEKMRLNIWLA
jgi:hypothetical protein